VLLHDSALDLDELAHNDRALNDYVRQRASLTHHVCGTCRMGRPDDPDAVVDVAGRVRGVDGLRIGDPSILPTIPTGGMHIPVIMVAEKLADQIKAEWASP